MSSGQKSCYEEENEWEHFQRNNVIFSEHWNLYSVEHRLAIEATKTYGFTGKFLIEYVEAKIALLNAQKSCEEKIKELTKNYQIYKKYAS